MSSKLIEKIGLFLLGVFVTIVVIQVVHKQQTLNVGTTSPSPTFKPHENTQIPQITSPKVGQVVTSPLTVTGSVPSGWMFEGSFPIALTDNQGNVISETTAREVIPGSWQKEGSIKFTAKFTFKTSESVGKLKLMKDNPSGLPENNVSYEVKILFKK